MRSASLRDKFRSNAVKPLYKKVKHNKHNKILITVDIDSSFHLEGDDINVKRKVNKHGVVNLISVKTKPNVLPGACEPNSNDVKNPEVKIVRGLWTDEVKQFKMLNDSDRFREITERNNGISYKIMQAKNNFMGVHKIPDTWLRVYPLPKLAEETFVSVLFRCVACQLGLYSVLVLWTIAWVFIIHSFEGPYETKVSIDFEKEQNQLVIDLATELRQITPLSPKWKNTIIKRIEDERQLTMLAIGRGAKLHPGQFWNLSGTFLFTVYVMTALGFGAPVPQTLWGRTSALIYALLAVPTHIYLMVNMSTCVNVHVESFIDRLRRKIQDKNPLVEGKTGLDNKKGSPNCSRNSEVLKTSKMCNFRRKIMRVIGVLFACRCVPLAMTAYYVTGAVAFGVLRDKEPLEVVMFPLEFTTSGGLEHVKSFVRVLYGFYVEGAMTLLACMLATIKRHNSPAVNCMSEKYRLFDIEKIED
ncbi:hypothetical protein O3G_MSEX004668 [Manduca sexta]|uniref:Potassium channel domain-containing protein n=1 Tax=Manduca sexta TaxID=7130 RepID=A0A922CHF0_MANSE|nr:hypothetical protein O3G_MSEX004668 [Manduca sexta]